MAGNDFRGHYGFYFKILWYSLVFYCGVLEKSIIMPSYLRGGVSSRTTVPAKKRVNQKLKNIDNGGSNLIQFGFHVANGSPVSRGKTTTPSSDVIASYACATRGNIPLASNNNIINNNNSVSSTYAPSSSSHSSKPLLSATYNITLTATIIIIIIINNNKLRTMASRLPVPPI